MPRAPRLDAGASEHFRERCQPVAEDAERRLSGRDSHPECEGAVGPKRYTLGVVRYPAGDGPVVEAPDAKIAVARV